MSGEDGPGAAARERRREQLRQWGARAGADPGPGARRVRTVRFDRAAEFLAACAGGDLEEARLMLLQAARPEAQARIGANPDANLDAHPDANLDASPDAHPGASAVLDSTNADGISALHQACIDENLEVVRFLVEQGATVNQADNEGWTPLHVAASCGHLDIARYLLSHGANVAAVNSDGDLALDLAEADAMEGLLRAEIARRGVDVEAAKRAEEELLLRDTRCWLNGGAMPEARHPRTGASALHVAAAKGYIEVMRLLLQAGYDPELRDWDGWTPLHAAAHWGVEDACRLLAEHGGGMDSLTHAGQRPCDLADEEVLSLLEELAQKQEDLRSQNASQNRGQEPQGPGGLKHRRSSVCRLSSREKISLQDLSKERRPEGAGDALIRDDEDGEEGPKGPPPAESRTLNGVSPLAPASPQSPVPPLEASPSKRSGLRKTGSAGTLGLSDRTSVSDMLGTGLQRSASSSGLETSPAQAREPRVARISPRPAQKEQEPSVPTPEPKAPAEQPNIPAAAPAPTADSRDRWRSYQMPVRDEESESQRKARSRLMRQSRRPTQGVTLTDLKEAEKVAGKAEPDKLSQQSGDPSRRPRVPGLDVSDGPTCREVPDGQGQGPQAGKEQQEGIGKDWRGPAEGEEAQLARGGTESRQPDPDPPDTQSEESDGESFRKLYAELRLENQRLREALTETTLQLAQLKVELERATQKHERFAERPALLELERFERRALERKASELEEELKALSDLRADNQRLKDENAALIRVISKLSK